MHEAHSKEIKVLIAPSAYKGSLSAFEIAKAIGSGLATRIRSEQIKSMPLADGGDDTIATIHACLGGIIRPLSVSGPLNEPVNSCWLKTNDCAVVELASSCGLATIEGPLQPLLAHTYGLGETIRDCLSEPCNKIVIGLGGSASTDGGTGALTALGIKFLDAHKNALPFGGGYLRDLASINMSALDVRVLDKEIEILADVRSPLLGQKGAASIFGPQKGATKEEIEILELGLKQLANKVAKITHTDLRNVPGCGAAGGTAFGLASLLNGHIKSGFATLAKIMGLEQEISDADIVITAEGKLDTQSFQGKATGELAKLCKNIGKPLLVLPAVYDENIDWQAYGLAAVYKTAAIGQNATIESIARTAAGLLLPIQE